MSADWQCSLNITIRPYHIRRRIGTRRRGRRVRPFASRKTGGGGDRGTCSLGRGHRYVSPTLSTPTSFFFPIILLEQTSPGTVRTASVGAFRRARKPRTLIILIRCNYYYYRRVVVHVCPAIHALTGHSSRSPAGRRAVQTAPSAVRRVFHPPSARNTVRLANNN